MNRRELLLGTLGACSAPLLRAPARLFAETSPTTNRLGIVSYCLGIRQRAQPDRRLADPLNLLQYCHRLGAGGIQVPLGVRDEAYCTKLRKRAEALGMYVEGIASPPRDEAGVERFDATLRTARQTGVSAVRVVIIPGRRYERFDSIDEFRQFEQRGGRSLELAAPIAERHRVRLAVENHKDQRIGPRLDLLRHIGSQYVGACVDVGNSFALMEDPVQSVEAFAPWAVAVHLKDQGVRPDEDGFLLADVPLGDGFLDLPRMVGILRKAKPQVRFSLEVITRDPLKVPCLTDKFWVTFAEVGGRDLARTLRTVRDGAAPEALQLISSLPLEDQVRQETDNVNRSLAYASQHLGL